jgi:hypothetical protein
MRRSKDAGVNGREMRSTILRWKADYVKRATVKYVRRRADLKAERGLILWEFSIAGGDHEGTGEDGEKQPWAKGGCT